ncbi:hypothetical protein [uncultured Nitrospira sp.]|uniref:hypothetical protein n=1 Tax=uncultured Nitrospira sp. TaxID=157176 RepID=UPI00314027F5
MNLGVVQGVPCAAHLRHTKNKSNRKQNRSAPFYGIASHTWERSDTMRIMTIPSTMGKICVWGLSLVFTGIAVWVMLVSLLVVRGSWMQEYSWDEMDWDKDGSTSISEFLKSSDIGKRPYTENAVDCIEY